METATLALTGAQQRALETMTRAARCLGASRTDAPAGFVNTQAARHLVDAGLATHEVSATGADVFVITDAGWEQVRDVDPAG